jgi:hypothetical protein
MYVSTQNTPRFRFTCLGCGRSDMNDTQRGCIADTNGAPFFKAYYHVACLPPVPPTAFQQGENR